MKSWLRLDRAFDPATLVAVTLAGLLPTGLILVISSLTLTEMSISLSDILEQPHRERVRAHSRIVAAELEYRYELWRSALQKSLASRGGPRGASPEFATTSLRSLVWVPVREPRDVLPVADDRAEIAEMYLRSIVHLDPEDRVEVLRDVATLPPEVEDELGFSYAIEAALAVDAPILNPLRVLEAPSLDRETLRAWRASLHEGSISLPGWPIPLAIELAAREAGDRVARLDPLDPFRLQLALPRVGSGKVIASFDVDSFLHEALESTLVASPPTEGIFTSLRYVAPIGASGSDAGAEAGVTVAGESITGRVWASWPLPPPFDHRYELVTGTNSDEPPVPLALLQRLEGFQLLWGGLLVVAFAVGLSLVLGALASRRVRTTMQKDNFLRLVSHELRTPIAAIRMIAETLALERVRNDEERAEFMSHLQIESYRLSDLVERVLEFGRGDAGTRNREVVTDPEDLVEGAVRRFQEGERTEPEGGGERSPVEIRSSQLFHPVLLDREAVTGVIHNLLSNARKYSPAGTPIEVTVGEESRQLFISVRDQGPGIRRRDQKRIFQSFYRGDSGSSKPGFGLGLAYCQQVAHAHRGRITVRSAVGRGSTFTLEIPLDAARSEGGEDG